MTEPPVSPDPSLAGGPAPRSFHWSDTRSALTAFCGVPVAANGRGFAGGGVRIDAPPVLPIGAGVATVGDYLEELPREPGAHLVILMQAGAASLGWFEHGTAVRTKTIKKYVVRGRGRAQPTHLASKGKSRYGSRLRLQNAKALLVETNQHMREWFAGFGTPDHIYVACPVRSWPELFATKPPPPFAKDTPVIRLPWDLPVPRTDVLLRTYGRMCHGRIETGGPQPVS